MFNVVTIKNVKTEIGQSVRKARKWNKLSQQELADRLNVSRVTIQNLESGKNFTIDTLLKVLEHFDMLDLLKQEIQKQMKAHEPVKSLY